MLSTMLRGYIEAMLWSSTAIDAEGQDLGSLEGLEVSPEAMKSCENACATFLAENQDRISAAIESRYDYDLSDIGHDFWLTRCGHGAGFWDRGDEPVWEELSEAAGAYGEVWPYVDEDGKVYL